MNDKNHYLTLALIHITLTLLMISYLNILVVIFAMIVLFITESVTYVLFKDRLMTIKDQEIKRLEYQMNKQERVTHESITQFESLSEIIDSGLLFIDENERIIQVNNLFKEIFNIRVQLKESYDQLKPIKPLYKEISRAFIAEDKYHAQIKYNDYTYEISVNPVFENKLFKGSLIVIRDITQLKTAEIFQKQFTADVSHELKTPLSAIKGMAEILSRDEPIEENERKDFIQSIYDESIRLETILNDLLIISKMDRLDYELKLKKTSMKAIIEDAIRLLSSYAQKKGLKLESDIKDCNLLIDPIKMNQVIINLIKNALNYTDKGGVVINAYSEKDYYVMKVIDTGIGIKEEDFEKVFKRFYRVDEARSRDSGGSGLGLSIIKNVVKKHHGTIELSSKVNEGSVFTVRLPLIQEID
ncbi:MAG: sensor histidine kinase [Candidatus Izemoplasmataceae bacterium]